MCRMSRRLWIPLVAIVALGLVGSAGAYIYFFSGLRTSPPSLELASPSASPSAGASANAGSWQIASGSLIGYRVKEQFVGQTSSHEAVARTGDLSGQVTIAQAGSSYQMTSAKVTVQLAGLASVDSVAGYNVTNRDRIVQRSLDVSSFPTAVFEAQSASLPAGGATGNGEMGSVPGNLTIPGETKLGTAAERARVSGRAGGAAGTGRT